MEMNDLPKGWTECALKEIVNYKKGTKPKILSEQKKKDFIPYIDIRAFERNEIRQYADIQSSKLSTYEDILVVWDGARCGLVGMGKEGAIGSTIMCLTPKVIDSRYIYNFLRTQYDKINTNNKGTGIPHVNPEIFWNIEFPLTPLNEQKRIVAKLDKLLSKVETAKARLDKIPQTLKRFRQSVLSAAVTGELTKEWREKNNKIGEAHFLLKKIEQDIIGSDYTKREKDKFLKFSSSSVLQSDQDEDDFELPGTWV